MPSIERNRQRWELQFPDLDDEWQYWWIDGDGELLAIILGTDLVVALNIVEHYHEQCQHIFAYRAKLDSFGEVVRNEHPRYVIATRESPTTDPQNPSFIL